MLINLLQSLADGYPLDWSDALAQILSVAFVMLCILPLHEFAHGWVAYKLGDPTAKNAGRLTMNPLKSLDPLGAAAMLLVGFGWAKPVPVDPRYFKNPKRGMALTALAGPLSNLLAAFIGAFVVMRMALAEMNAVTLFIFQALYYYVMVNISLAVFNLVPIPPLDGAKVLGAFLPDQAYFGLMRYERYGMLLLLALSWLGVTGGFISGAILRVYQFMFELFY